jgi:protein SCO1/2
MPTKTFALLALVLITDALPGSAQSRGQIKPVESARVSVSQAAPDFTLTDQEGKARRFRSLAGKVVLATFIYTTCPDVCPLLTAKFAAIQRELKSAKRDDFFLVSITTDPKTDTPKVLKAYGDRYHADFQSWAFLTGSEADLKNAWRAFGVSVNARDEGKSQHTTVTTLIDPRGVRRINYYGDRWQEKDVVNDLIQLMKAQ